MEDSNEKKSFKITTSHIGDYLVLKMDVVQKIFGGGYPFGVQATAGGKSVSDIYAVMQIRFRSEGVTDVDYKINLRPIGVYRSCVADRNWYTCDIEHRMDETFYGDEGYKCFDDPVDALEYAAKMNEKLYPKEEPLGIIGFFKAVCLFFKIFCKKIKEKY